MAAQELADDPLVERGKDLEVLRLMTGERSHAPSRGRDPYWAYLPRWTARLCRERAGAPADLARLLRNVNRGQEALFRAVRIHDDVFDGQTSDRSAVFAGDRALVEAERAFSTHLGGHDGFWRFYRDSLDATVRAIVEVDTLERRRGAFGRAALPAHARVASIFKVGAAAVAAAHDDLEGIRRLNRLADALAIAGQIVDDLEDVDEDLRRGRYTFAANVLLAAGRPPSASPAAIGRALSRAFAMGAYGEVLRAAQQRLDAAARAARAIGLPAAEAHVAEFRRGLESWERLLHRRRVEGWLGPLARRQARLRT